MVTNRLTAWGMGYARSGATAAGIGCEGIDRARGVGLLAGQQGQPVQTGLTVIANGTMRAFGHRRSTPRQVAGELGVRFLVDDRYRPSRWSRHSLSGAPPPRSHQRLGLRTPPLHRSATAHTCRIRQESVIDSPP